MTVNSGNTGKPPFAGVSVENTAALTLYVRESGKVKVLLPFELNIVKLNPYGFEPEHHQQGVAPISGPIRPAIPSGASQYQPYVPTYNSNGQRIYVPNTAYQQYPYTPERNSYNSYQPQNYPARNITYQQYPPSVQVPARVSYNNYQQPQNYPVYSNQYQQSAYANRNAYNQPAYVQPLRRVDVSQIRPKWPTFNRPASQQVGK